MKTIKIAGVPEHFNLPWHLCIENAEFERVGLDLQWIDVPEGTGKMCEMLRQGETDVAVLLTEGIIRDIAAGNDSSIVQVYVQSPLQWGIHVSGQSTVNTVSGLCGTTAAVSRLGSGSHLMTFINAKNQNWNTNTLTFETVNTIEGAIEALQNDKAAYFMWEKFMTKPLVDNGIFKRVGVCPSPWPCFVIAVRNEFLNKNTETIALVLEIINQTTTDFKRIPSIDKTLSVRYKQELEDIQEWLKDTLWSQKKLDQNTFDKVQEELFNLGLITNKTKYQEAVK